MNNRAVTAKADTPPIVASGGSRAPGRYLKVPYAAAIMARAMARWRTIRNHRAQLLCPRTVRTLSLRGMTKTERM